jgi:4-alpha-glucanotransferase
MLPDSLRDLARLYGVELRYVSAAGETVDARESSLLPILRTLGANVASAADAPAAIAARRAELAGCVLEPTRVLWETEPARIPLRAAENATGTVSARLVCEDGSQSNWTRSLEDLSVRGITSEAGARQVFRELTFPSRPATGYHRLDVTVGAKTWTCHLLCAPEASYLPVDPARKSWGLFLPLYALRSETDWGIGDFGDLRRFLDWTAGLGGELVATLPLLAAFLGEQPFEYSPYSPASRLFWNELFLDVTAIPEYAGSAAARALAESPAFRETVAQLGKDDFVDYAAAMRLKRSVLEILCRELLASDGPRRAAFEATLAERPELRDYAEFRAVCERRGASWWTWPEPLRSGTVAEGDYDPAARDYHAYAQWIADEQLAAFAEHAGKTGPGLYLDVPLGVNSDGYDVWRMRESFAVDMSAGAPPDPFFPGGQCWGFPPLHPRRLAETGYAYFRDVIRHHCRHAGIVRLDHIMGLTRLYWIPHGVSAKEGIYVRYGLEHFMAILCIESHRHRTVLVGEDLGTVPPEIPAAMRRHKVHQMYVAQFSIDPKSEETLVLPPATAYANVNSHDMPPFAAFWSGTDIEERVALNILDAKQAEESRVWRASMRESLLEGLRAAGCLGERDEHVSQVFAALLRAVASGDAPVLLVNLEDLWQETAPQNVPGTWRECPNWRRKARMTLEEIGKSRAFAEALRELDGLVRSAR